MPLDGSCCREPAGWMCGCGRLILVESGAHSWTIIGVGQMCLIDRIFYLFIFNSDTWGFLLFGEGLIALLRMQKTPPVTVQI